MSRLSGTACALMMAAVTAALAAPVPSLAQPGESLGPPLPTQPQPQAQAAPNAATGSRTEAWLKTLAEASKSWMQHLPASERELTLGGERAVVKVPVFIAPQDVGHVSEFRLAAISAISALPEASQLQIFVNGTSLGSVRPRTSGASSMKVPIEPGQLVPGFNEVMFIATHQHRIDCSLEGTYELWTSIIASRTGFVATQSEERRLAVAELPSILGRNEAPTVLRVHAPSELDNAMATRLARFVNAVVLNGWIANPKVVLARGQDRGPGIDLKLLASPPSNGGTSVHHERFADTRSLYLATKASGETDALILAGTMAEIDRELDRMEDKARARTPIGSPRGQAALVSAFGGELGSAGQMSFASLGIDDVTFAGRHFSLDIPALLPGDYYQADYGSLLLYLDGSYAPNLLPGSMLIVKVNGVETANLELNDAGSTFRSKEVRVPLKLFHAGMNTLTLEADLVTAADQACAPEHAPVMTPRFRLANTSRIVVPTMARVGVVPNLAATMSHGLPYTLDEAPTDVFVVGERRPGFEATLAVLTEITANAQRVERFDIAFRPPTEDEGGLLIGAPDALPSWAREMIGPRIAADEPDEPDTPDELILGRDEAQPLAPVLVAGRSDTMTDVLPLRQQFAGTNEPAGEGLYERSRRTVEATLGWLRGGGIELDALWREAKEVTSLLLDREEGRVRERHYREDDVAFAQQAYADMSGMEAVSAAVLRHSPPRTWTVIAAEEPAQLSEAFDGASPTGVRFNPSGQHYVFSDARDRMIEAGEAGRLYATQSPRLGNLRLVLAGWLSANVEIYVYAILSLVSLLGALTYLTVRRRRVARAS